MDNTAIYKLCYGVFMVASKNGDAINGCITNTCIQVASNPTRIACAVLNKNLTCDYIKASGKFTVSILDKECSFDTIKHFGLQSGRDVNKFEYLEPSVDAEGIPYMGWSTLAMLSASVVESHDLGSHTLFIAEVTDAKNLGEGEPMTYSYYQSDVKPKPAAAAEVRKPKAWRCTICGYVYEGEVLPPDFVCPLCAHPASDFEPIY